MSGIVHGAVDCDVHIEPSSINELKKYLSSYWLEYLWGAGRVDVKSAHRLYPPDIPLAARTEARDRGTFPPHDYASLREQLLEPYEAPVVVLNCIATFLAGRNPYYQAAITRAMNEWVRDEWLEKDPRLRASIVVPTLDPEAAAAEIDRLGSDRRFVQVLLPIRSETPWGNKRWQLIHDAAARNDLPLAFHAWGELGSSPTTMGYTHTYYEDYVSISQVTAPTQLLSLVSEGVFDRHRSLKVCFLECGFSWIPSFLWQFDKDWKSLWREVPWMRERPSIYVQRHVRATTTPAQLRGVPAEHIAQLITHLGASELLVYASDYPHDHGDDGLDTLLGLLDGPGRDAVLRHNAATLYGLSPRVFEPSEV